MSTHPSGQGRPAQAGAHHPAQMLQLLCAKVSSRPICELWTHSFPGLATTCQGSCYSWIQFPKTIVGPIHLPSLNWPTTCFSLNSLYFASYLSFSGFHPSKLNLEIPLHLIWRWVLCQEVHPWSHARKEPTSMKPPAFCACLHLSLSDGKCPKSKQARNK